MYFPNCLCKWLDVVLPLWWRCLQSRRRHSRSRTKRSTWTATTALARQLSIWRKKLQVQFGCSFFLYKKKSMNAGCSPVDCSYESHTENGNLVYSVSSAVQCLNSMPSTPSIDSEYAVTLNYVNPAACSGTLYAAGYSPASTCIPFAVTVEGTSVITYASVSLKFLIIIYFLS